jgi:CheY-like chemotaxis protein
LAFVAQEISAPDDDMSVHRVVVIDDDETVAAVVAAVLQARGFSVNVALSGSAGIRLVREVIPDAVVCDMRMPEIGGHEVTLMLKAQPSTSHIPVVLITGDCEMEFVGMGDAFLYKPFHPHELYAALDRAAA